MKKKVLILLPTLHLGGAERIAVNTVDILKDSCEMHLAVFNGKDPVYHPDCDVIDLQCPATSNKLQKVANALKRAAKVKKLKKELDIDICLSFAEAGNLVNVLTKGKEKCFTRIDGFLKVNKSRISRFIYEKSDGIICVSQEMKEKMDELYPDFREKIYAVYNPYDLQNVEEKGKEPVDDCQFTGCTLVTHGRLNPVKNQKRLIQALALVRKELPDVKLLIVGDGDLRGALETQIRELNLEDAVSLIGFRSNPYAYLAKASAYVLPSASEGFPNSLVEGMVFLPVIAADCSSGPREILAGSLSEHIQTGYEVVHDGILVSQCADTSSDFHKDLKAQDLADAILALLKDPELMKKLKQNAHARAQAFGYDSYREIMEDLFGL